MVTDYIPVAYCYRTSPLATCKHNVNVRPRIVTASNPSNPTIYCLNQSLIGRTASLDPVNINEYIFKLGHHSFLLFQRL